MAKRQPDNIKDGQRIAVTHGELCLIPVDALPVGEVVTHKLYVAAHSETGHHHIIESKAGVQVLDGIERFLLVNDVARLFHQKSYDIHETRFIAPGAYQVTEKIEYDPFQKIVRRVFD